MLYQQGDGRLDASWRPSALRSPCQPPRPARSQRRQRPLQARSPAAVFTTLTVVVHHSGKDASRGSRGSTVLPAAVDAQIEIERDGVAKVSTATLVKSRDGETGEMFSFELAVVKLGQDDDGDVITSCVVEVVDGVKKRPKLSPRQRRALDLLLNLIVDEGKPAPGETHYPPNCRVVSVALWREYLITAGVIDKGAKNPRADFKRIRDSLIERGAAGEWAEKIWAVTNEK